MSEATVPMSVFANTIYKNKYAHTVGVNGSSRKEEWAETAERVAKSVMGAYMPSATVEKVQKLIEQRKFMPGGRYLYAAGRRYPQVNSCFLFSAEDHKEGWGELMNKITVSLMTGGGIGVVYNKLRAEGENVSGMGGKSTGPLALMRMVNEAGRYIMQGGSRRSAIWAGLLWSHPDCFKFMAMKNWSAAVHSCRSEDFNFPAPMDGTNISIILDDDFFQAFNDPTWTRTYRLGNSSYTCTHKTARDLYWTSICSMMQTGEPGFSIDIGENSGEHLRNACTEVSSSTTDDMCNLSSWNLAKYDSLEEFEQDQVLGVGFLMCGTLYSKLPVENMYRVREKNRRLGLGLMGVHEWLLKRSYRYEQNPELTKWMEVYALSGQHANLWADKFGVSRPVATRSVAPNGTISIIAETTSGIEPIFATAFKRRYLDGKSWKAQYVIDATAKRLIDGNNVDPELIEDSMTLARDVERRVKFQGWLQQYVDHGISSTLNLPAWGSEHNNEGKVTQFGESLLRHLPNLRGITAYPDGARGGQPLVKVPYHEAAMSQGVEFEDNSELQCKGGVCGI